MIERPGCPEPRARAVTTQSVYCEGPSSKFEHEDGQTDHEKDGTCERL